MQQLHVRYSCLVCIALVSVLSACAARRPQRHRSLPPRVTHTTSPTPTPTATPTPTRRLEEMPIEETPAVPVPTEPSAVAPEPTIAATSSEPESLLSRINATTPPNVSAALRLIEDGRQQMSRGEPDLALERFERAVAIDPTNTYGYYFLARLHYEKKEYDQAIAFANRAAALGARTDRVWVGRALALEGAVFEQVGRYADARNAYRKAVEADPNNLAAHAGFARLATGEMDGGPP